MERTTFGPPRARLLLLAATTGGLGAVGLLLASSEVPFWRGAGVLAVAGLGLATGVLLARALRPGPTVVVDAEGITDRTTLLPTGLVGWEEMAGVRKREIGRGMGRERLLEIVLVDPDRFGTRPRSRARRLADGYRSLIRQPAVTIPGSMVAVPMATVVSALRRWRPDLDVLELPPPRPGLLARLGRSKASKTQPPHDPRATLPRW